MLNLFGLKIHPYGLLIGIGVWLGFEISIYLNKDKNNNKILERVFAWAVIGGILGARLYHVLDFWNRYYSQNLIKIFFLWEGGLGIWGAIAGALVGILLFCGRYKYNFLKITDSLIVGVPVAQAIGRLGNFVNGELYGKNGEPLFAYEAILNLLLFAILWRLSRNKLREGKLFGIYLIGYGIIRILLEGLRPEEIIWQVGGIPTAVIFGVVAIIAGSWIATVRVRNSQ